MASNSNHGNAKKMSLEEFLGDESLGASVWDESDINLDAITNTTNIDLFRQAKNKSNDARGHNPSHNSNNNNYHRDPHAFNDVEDIENNGSMPGPPYIVKFSNLPPKFSNRDIEELFQAKFTKFIKFKLFWELNVNPSIETMKNGTEFEQNFKLESKVAFVELYTARDLQKIANFWKEPLRDIYNINTEIAIFENFKEYISKADLLKNDPQIDAGRPFIEHKHKPSPFGSAKPTDTQSVTLEIEKKMDELHVEDTTTLRRLSQNEGESAPLASLVRQSDPLIDNHHHDASVEKPKITILKKPTLSYSEVLQKSVEETKKHGSASPTHSYYQSTESSPMTTTNLADSAIEDDETQTNTDNTSNAINDNVEGSKTTETGSNETMADSSDATQFKDKDNDRSGNNNSYKSRRGGYTNRERGSSRGGYHNNRGGYNSDRGGRGGYKSYSNNNDNFNKGSKYSRDQNDNNSSSERKEKNEKADSQSYSLFKPASSFLHNESSSNNDGRSSNNDHRGYNNNRGNDRGHGRGRGGRGGRGRGRGGFNRGGHSNFRGQSD